MRSYYIKNRIFIGNRRDCDIYVKYHKPIVLYIGGIVNFSKTIIKINGKTFQTHCKYYLGDLIEIGALKIRVLADRIILEGEYHTTLIEKLTAQHQYNCFIPEIEMLSFQSTTIEIPTFNEQMQTVKVLNHIVMTATSFVVTITMYLMFSNTKQLWIMIAVNVFVMFFQIFMIILERRQYRQQYNDKKIGYEKSLFELQEKIFHLVNAYLKNQNIYRSNKVFSRSPYCDTCIEVDVGKIPQQFLKLKYTPINKWKNTSLDEVIFKMINYYEKLQQLKIIDLKNKKTLIKNNVYLLKHLLSQLVKYYNYDVLKIKIVGKLEYYGKHFSHIKISDVIEDNSLYIFDKYYLELANLNITCIVLDDYIHYPYDLILEEYEDKIFIKNENCLVEFENDLDFKSINTEVQKYTTAEVEWHIPQYTLFDVHHEISWNCNVKENIKAYLTKDVVVDLHEKGDGPHGLIVGMTGSGKSELLLSLVSSLCLNYHPNQLQIVAIDYKGRAFASKIKDFPHVIGVLDNLSRNIYRSIEVLKKEIKNRQVYLKEHFYSHVDETHLPHLIIICDEFAELKKEEPDFINELISISRIGRSLGIHLLLATQKPSGIISEEILNNADLKIVLRLNDKSESQHIMNSDKAYYLKQPGEAILNTNSTQIKFKCMYSSNKACIKNDNRIVVNDTEIINEHQYFDFTERDYFINKMPKNKEDIFLELPLIQSNCAILKDELLVHEEQRFVLQNTVIYGDYETGKTTTLITLISAIDEGAIYYIYEDSPLSYQKVVNIHINDYSKIAKLFYHLLNDNDKKIVCIDRYDLLKDLECFEQFDELIRKSPKNNIYFIITSTEELKYALQQYFSLKIIHYYDKEIMRQFGVKDRKSLSKIPGRAIIDNYEVQIGIDVPAIDYEIAEKHFLTKKQQLKLGDIGYHFLSLSPINIVGKIYIFAKEKEKIKKYLNSVQLQNYEIVVKEEQLYDYQYKEHKLFLDEYSLSVFGDFNTILEENEAMYISLRKKIKIQY